MNSIVVLFTLSCYVALASSAVLDPFTIPRPQLQLNVFGNSKDTITTESKPVFGITDLQLRAEQPTSLTQYKKLIENLVENLSIAAQQAREAVAHFSEGIQTQLSRGLDKFQADLAQLRDRVATSIQAVTDRFENAGAGVGECVEATSSKSDTIFQEAVERTRSCAEDRLNEGKELVSTLASIPDEVRELAATTFAEMRNCTSQNGNVVAAGSCLGGVAVRAELKGAGLVAQSGLSIARVNLFVSTLPAALEVCAGSGLLGAGFSTARLIMQVGSCSASSIFTSLSGSTPDQF